MRFSIAWAAGALALGLCAGPVGAAQLDPSVRAMFSETSLAVPTVNRLIICHGFGCARRTPMALTTADRAKLAQLMASGRKSPVAERQALAAALAWFDHRFGPLAGTVRRVARAGPAQSGDPGQLDCIDTSRNTTSLFVVLEDLRLLRHHVIAGPQSRGFFLAGQIPHTTAVLAERTSGKKWAIDPWTRAYGQLPEVMPLESWEKAQ